MSGMFLWIVIVILIIAFVWLFFISYRWDYGSVRFLHVFMYPLVIDRNAHQKGASFHYYQCTGKCHKAGLSLKADDLEAHFLAGGNVRSVVKCAYFSR